ncbi:MAG: ABC transporter ATP-binding protein [Planctomycetota bacterium]
MVEEPVLEVDCISKSFATPSGMLRVLDGVSFSLAAGQPMAIMGPSGSGKSTLLSILGGLEEPTSGSVRLSGIQTPAHSGDSARVRAAFRNRHVGFVFQEHHLLGGCTAIDNVVLPGLATAAVSRQIEARGRWLLERVGLASRMWHLPSELSGGERQRVAVARALLLSPQLILADEPTGQLDAHAAAEVTTLLIQLTAEAGGVLVVATHSAAVATRIGTIRHLVDGRLPP